MKVKSVSIEPMSHYYHNSEPAELITAEVEIEGRTYRVQTTVNPRLSAGDKLIKMRQAVAACLDDRLLIEAFRDVSLLAPKRA